MTETRIAFSQRERRNHFVAVGAITLIAGGLGLLTFVRSPNPTDRWSTPVLIAAIWLPCIFYSINRMFGITVLTSEGMQFRTLVSRRRIPWVAVTQVEAQRRNGRGGPWWVIRIHIANRRAVVLPGAMLSQRGQAEAGFGNSVDMICSHWQQATGRTDEPVYSE